METKAYQVIDSVESLNEAISRVRAAQKVFSTYTQEQVDKIFLAAATAADRARISLARLAWIDIAVSLDVIWSFFINSGPVLNCSYCSGFNKKFPFFIIKNATNA